jgi:steroid 5-alpha reductase family enzyme
LLFLPSFILKTEKYFDITGTIAYVSIIIYVIFEFKRANVTISFQSIVISAMVLIWALRLGIFLFIRIFKFKNDSRFDDAKKSFFKFLRFWMISALWVFLTTINAMTLIINNQNGDLFSSLTIGIFVWVIGFLIEFIADLQKYNFRKKQKHDFIDTGIWKYSQHPNYFGEITMWIGIAIISLTNLIGVQFFTLISPIFVYLLLTKVSGINLLDASAKIKWGKDQRYIEYINTTPKLIPNFLKKGTYND